MLSPHSEISLNFALSFQLSPEVFTCYTFGVFTLPSDKTTVTNAEIKSTKGHRLLVLYALILMVNIVSIVAVIMPEDKH